MEDTENIDENELLVFDFIATVKKHPALYDKSSKAYRDVVLKEKIWLSVANHTKLTSKYAGY